MKDSPQYEEDVAAKEPEPDRRIGAMHRLIDSERELDGARRELERAQKQAAIAQERLEQAHQEVRELLGISGVAVNNNTRADW